MAAREISGGGMENVGGNEMKEMEGCIDMQKLHKMFISLNSCTHHGDFLDVLTQLRRIPQDLKVSCVYKAYLTRKLEYLVRFYKCAKPVEDLHHIFSKHTLNLNDQYDDIKVVASLEARITILCETLSKEKEDNSPLLLKGNSSNFTLRSDIKKILLSHQIEGVKWLWGLHLEEAGGGGILANDMGVGKTLQIAAFILGLFESDLTKKVLVVCPKTLLSVWFNQFSKMGLPPKNYIGRKKYVELEEFKQKEKGILLTSYGMITKDSNTLCQMIFDYSILDEGHIIKNPKSKTSINIRSIKSAHRILVTGTPIQNNYEELWSLYNYCAPKILGDIKFFKDEVKPLKRGVGTNATTSEKSFSRDAKKKLDRAIRPYFLRRTIEQVFTKGEIPEKTELVIWLKLSRCQQALYKGIVRSEVFGAARSSVPFAAITILRKVCCDPSLTRAWKDNKEERTIGTMQEDKHKYNAQMLALKMDEITSSYGKEFKSCKLS